MSLRIVFVIAKNTFREAIRDRILYGILAFGGLYVLLSLFMARLALGDFLMVRSFGLAGIYLFGVLATVFLGSSIIYKEIERRTLYFVLAKPVSRRDVLLGKFVGLFAATLLTVALMAVIYLGVILSAGGGWDWGGLFAIGFEVLELALLTALLIFLSTVASPLFATLCAVILLFSGHLLSTVAANARAMNAAVNALVNFLYYVLPNLEKFNIRNLVVHGVSVPAGEAFWTAAYALLYVLLSLFLAGIFFKNKEL